MFFFIKSFAPWEMCTASTAYTLKYYNFGRYLTRDIEQAKALESQPARLLFFYILKRRCPKVPCENREVGIHYAFFGQQLVSTETGHPPLSL